MTLCILLFGFCFAVVSSYQNVKTFYIPTENACSDSCLFTLVESIPENLTYPSHVPIKLSTYLAHKRLIEKAKHEIHIASFYWSLIGSDISYHDYSSWQGEDIFKRLKEKLKSGSVSVHIAQNNTNHDTKTLQEFGAEVRTLDFKTLVGGGVLHTKMWVVDSSHAYIGSGNFDWRSYTQTKEAGVLIEDCPCIASDAEKLFQAYWYLGKANATVPVHWPERFTTEINLSNPASVKYNTTQGLVYLSSSPPEFCAKGRTIDIKAILNVISSAEKFIYISVMDYLPAIMYQPHHTYWPVIDDALRKAAYDRHVQVCLLASHWNYTIKDMYSFLRSLNAMGRLHKTPLEVRLFTVPSYTQSQEKIPFARVDHSKYMVTDQHAYIGTSNWSGDYFIYTGGVAFVLKQQGNETTNLRQQLVDMFKRDWNSTFTKPVY